MVDLCSCLWISLYLGVQSGYVMYRRNISDVHLPILKIVVSEAPLSFRDIAPPALQEKTPTKSVVMPLFQVEVC